jgi:hypothetical protein
VQIESRLSDLLANSITHGTGTVLAGAVCLVVASARGVIDV